VEGPNERSTAGRGPWSPPGWTDQQEVEVMGLSPGRLDLHGGECGGGDTLVERKEQIL
jgi:hypothetical protein